MSLQNRECGSCGRTVIGEMNHSRADAFPGMWCKACYMRWRRHGTPTPPATPSRGRLACFPLFSDEDADLRLAKWTKTKPGYAARSKHIPAKKKKSRQIFSHRVVLSRMLGRELSPSDICDHINGDRLDNRRENLRLTDYVGNAQNKTFAKSKCGYRGVTLHRQTGRWQAQVVFQGKSFYLGLYDSPEKAAAVAAAKRNELGFLRSST